MKKQGCFFQIFVIGGISIERAGAPWATPRLYAYDFEIRSFNSSFIKKGLPLSSFIKKKIKAKLK